MLRIVPPAPELDRLVASYWFVEDLPGDHAGRLIRTSPVPLAVLSVNMGRPNTAETGEPVPAVSLLGLQSKSRGWRSGADTAFVMVMLTIPGLVRLFPHSGSATADRLVDLAALTGDGPAQSLHDRSGADRRPDVIAAALDRWLMSRLAQTRPVAEGWQIATAHSVLRGGGTVDTAADAALIHRRQLHRLFRRHLGVGPKALADLERLHLSLTRVRSGQGEPVQGFSDQAHQIRSWRRRLGVTPGAYARAPRTPLAEEVRAQGVASDIAYYL